MALKYKINPYDNLYKPNFLKKFMSLWEKFKLFIIESKRVFRSTKKPSKEEYIAIVKVSGIGVLIIGFLGFLIHMISSLIR